jgi:hypothetical protein
VRRVCPLRAEGRPARGGVLAHAGDGSPDADIIDWAEQRMLSACAKDETEVLGFVTDDSIRVVGRASYCAAPMIARRGMEELVVGLLVLRFDNNAPSMPGSQVLYALAAHLLEASQDRTSAASVLSAGPAALAAHFFERSANCMVACVQSTRRFLNRGPVYV